MRSKRSWCRSICATRSSRGTEPSSCVSIDCHWATPEDWCGRFARATASGRRKPGHVRCLELLRRACGIEAGISFHLVKRIPSAAGLGGGSSDAAAALVAANTIWNLDWSREALAKVAAELGSDVPFFLGSQAAVCRGRGEQIEELSGLGALHFVVVRPPEGLSTQVRVCQLPRAATTADGDGINCLFACGGRAPTGGIDLQRVGNRRRAALAVGAPLAAGASARRLFGGSDERKWI